MRRTRKFSLNSDKAKGLRPRPAAGGYTHSIKPEAPIQYMRRGGARAPRLSSLTRRGRALVAPHRSETNSTGEQQFCGSEREAGRRAQTSGAGFRWSTGAVKTMRFMFDEASSFNQPLGGWRVDQVMDMTGMFEDASAFNQPLGHWRIDEVRVRRRRSPLRVRLPGTPPRPDEEQPATPKLDRRRNLKLQGDLP